MLAVTFADGESAPRAPLSLLRSLEQIHWRVFGVPDQNAEGEIIFAGSEESIEDARHLLKKWILKLPREASVHEYEDSESEGSSLTKPDMKSDDTIADNPR